MRIHLPDVSQRARGRTTNSALQIRHQQDQAVNVIMEWGLIGCRRSLGKRAQIGVSGRGLRHYCTPPPTRVVFGETPLAGTGKCFFWQPSPNLCTLHTCGGRHKSNNTARKLKVAQGLTPNYSLVSLAPQRRPRI